MERIYLDSASTTQIYDSVKKEIDKTSSELYGNPSSLHLLGEKAMEKINLSRKKIAEKINARPWEIIFTSGATESNNLALRCIDAGRSRNINIISSIEHPSVRETAKHLQKTGQGLLEIPVDKSGRIDIDFLRKELEKNRNKIRIVSVMHVNNILGVIQDIDEIGRLCRKNKVLFHTDAVQSFGKIRIDVKKTGIDLLSASAHKIGGPKGVGFLYAREGVKIWPLFHGGGQERGVRSGTENTPGIAGFSKAVEEIGRINRKKIEKLKKKLINGLGKIGAKINSPEDGVSNIIHTSFPGFSGEEIVYRLSEKGIYVSSGSACDSKKEKEDHVLKAIGLGKREIAGSIRISLSEKNSEGDIEKIIKELSEILKI